MEPNVCFKKDIHQEISIIGCKLLQIAQTKTKQYPKFVYFLIILTEVILITAKKEKEKEKNKKENLQNEKKK